MKVKEMSVDALSGNSKPVRLTGFLVFSLQCIAFAFHRCFCDILNLILTAVILVNNKNNKYENFLSGEWLLAFRGFSRVESLNQPGRYITVVLKHRVPTKFFKVIYT